MNKEASKYLTRELKKLADNSEYSINQLRVQVALERILARVVTNHKLTEKLIFKGGLVLARVYGSSRYTRDIDALGKDADVSWLKDEVVNTLEKDIDDGFWFGNIQIEDLEHQGKYDGLRFDMAFQIGEPKVSKIHKLPRIHFDIGIGDSIGEVVPSLALIPLIKIGEPISWKVYPPEFIYSEKLETLVSRGSESSRAKDYHDLCLLASEVEMNKLVDAIKVTFTNRATEIPNSFVDFLCSLDFSNILPSWKAQGLGDFETTLKSLKSKFADIDKNMNLNE